VRFWRTDEIRALGAGDALQVARSTGRSPRAVQDKARRQGMQAPRMPHAQYWPEATRRRALALRQAGYSVARVSRITGVPFGTVRRWVYAEAA
jgi:hypothetical protein